MGLLLRYRLRVQPVLLRFLFAVRLSRLVLTLCNLEQYEVDTISGDIVKTLHVIVGFVKRNFVCESKFSWWLFQLVVLSRFCLKTLPLNTPLFEETVFEKSQVFNLSRFKISICIWWCFLCSGSNIWDDRMSFCTVLLESTVIKFLLGNKEIKVFPGKVTLKERS